MKPIYLDYHSTTPIDSRVLNQMLPYLKENYGNPSNRNHVFGWTASSAVENAREQVAELLGAQPSEIIFTSGATESVHLALLGLADANAASGKNHIITTAIEHKCTFGACELLKKRGFEITYLSVDSEGKISLEDLQTKLTPKTLCVSIIGANNEIGTIQDLKKIGEICRKKEVFFHVDAAQTVGKIPVNVQELKIDLLSVSSHKLYGPKGVGALYCRRKDPRVTLCPQMIGGGQEKGLRAGTLNVAGIVGFGEACKIVKSELSDEMEKTRTLRDRFWKALSAQLPNIHFNGHETDRLPQNLNVTFLGIEAEPLMIELKNIAFSAGSACSSDSFSGSHVLKAIGLSEAEIRGSIRFGLGRMTTWEELEQVVKQLVPVVKKIRSLSILAVSDGKDESIYDSND